MNTTEENNQLSADEIWAENEAYIRKFCKYKLSSKSDLVDDCVHEVFTAFLIALNQGKEINNPKAWLTSVANNKVKDIYTQSKKEAEITVPYSADIVDKIADSPVEAIYVSEERILHIKEEIISSLNNSEQKLLDDRYGRKKSINQISVELNTTENNVYQKLFRLRQKVKAKIIEKLHDSNL